HVVRLANASQTSPPTVGVAEAGTDDAQTVIGVARNAAAAAGDLVEVVVLGFALAQGDGSVTAGSWVTYDSNGRVASETVDASDVVGTLVGRALADDRSEEHTSELQSRENLVCRLLLEKKKKTQTTQD